MSSGKTFVIGLGIKAVKAVTCNGSWKEEFIIDSPIGYKLAMIGGLRLFFDYGENASSNIQN
jgi:hypothetical protein